ncbi:hypothetical protein [Microbacterium xanthum]|uniref:hypothetical protein n=1 Tax=Microbacterium xanthum TaxID=3079794 RepID=UPI002AD4D3FE|nr:hypothetical protein [Microbacterium sp. KSW-48]MDZ8173265.1 hypothetical protein [Microbacterium sp. KSW-48]
MKRRGLLVLVAGITFMLAGCGASSLPEFTREQTADDAITALPAQEPSIDPNSTRFVGTVESTDLYLARAENDALCVIQLQGDEWEQTGCATGDGIGIELESGTLIEAGTYAFPENQVKDGQRVKLSESVSVITFP